MFPLESATRLYGLVKVLEVKLESRYPVLLLVPASSETVSKNRVKITKYCVY